MSPTLFERIANIIKMALFFFMLNLNFGQGGMTSGTPVYDVISTINVPFLIEAYKDLPHCLGQPFIHGKSFPAPVAGTAQSS